MNSESLLTLSEMSRAVSGCVEGNESAVFCSAETDSRKIKKDFLFIPTHGEKSDGHDFIEDALNRGASVVFIEEGEWKERAFEFTRLLKKFRNASFIRVQNNIAALQNAAAFYIDKFPRLIRIGITGSNGKTTVKRMIASVLSERFSVVESTGNYNSETGLPLSCFNVRRGREVAVFELGMNRKGEIAEITRVFRPNYALITNIGTAHIGILGSRKAIAAEKKAIFAYTKGGAAFVPEGDDFCDFLKEGLSGEAIESGESFLDAVFLRDEGIDGLFFSLSGEEIHLHAPGKHNYRDALLAACIAKRLGLTNEEIKRGLEKFRPVENRSDVAWEILRNGKKVCLLKDFYNANPSSMEAALNLFNSSSGFSKKIAILGDMKELGDFSEEMHKNIGSLCANFSFDAMFFVGEEMKNAYEKNNGNKNAFWFSADELCFVADALLEKASENSLILLKASRSLKFERLLSFLLKDGSA